MPFNDFDNYMNDVATEPNIPLNEFDSYDVSNSEETNMDIPLAELKTQLGSGNVNPDVFNASDPMYDPYTYLNYLYNFYDDYYYYDHIGDEFQFGSQKDTRVKLLEKFKETFLNEER